jgi:hypothetical protein
MKNLSSLIILVIVSSVATLAGGKYTPPPVTVVAPADVNTFIEFKKLNPSAKIVVDTNRVSVAPQPKPVRKVFDYDTQYSTNTSVFKDGQWMTQVASRDGVAFFPKGTNTITVYPGGPQADWHRGPEKDPVATREAPVSASVQKSRVVYTTPNYSTSYPDYSYSPVYSGGYSGGYGGGGYYGDGFYHGRRTVVYSSSVGADFVVGAGGGTGWYHGRRW